MSTTTLSQKMAAAGYTRRTSLWAMEAREALVLIATPMRPDGTWNHDREACRQLAVEALGDRGLTERFNQNFIDDVQAALAAVSTLQGLGYTYNGGERWKPPLGKNKYD